LKNDDDDDNNDNLMNYILVTLQSNQIDS